MDYAGIDWALLHVDAALSKDVEYLAACVRAYPDRLRSMAPVDEWRIASEPDAVIAEATAAIEVHGLHAFKIIPEYAYRFEPDADASTDAAWRPFWDAVTALDVPIFFTHRAASRGRPIARQGFLDELWTVARWMDRYPDARVSITHGFPWRDLIVGDRIEVPDAMLGAVPRPAQPDHRGQLPGPDRRPVRLPVDASASRSSRRWSSRSAPTGCCGAPTCRSRTGSARTANHANGSSATARSSSRTRSRRSWAGRPPACCASRAA